MTNDEILKVKRDVTNDLLDWRQRQMFFMSPSEKSRWFDLLNEKIKRYTEADKLKFKKEQT